MRCKHGLIPEQCAICIGLVTARNQTREYGEEDQDPGPDLDGLPPAVWNQTGNLPYVLEAADDLADTDLDEFDKQKPIPVIPAKAGTKASKENEMSDKPRCKFPKCPKEAFAQGFCQGHYDRWRHGRLPGDWPAFVRVQQRHAKPGAEKPPTPRRRMRAVKPAATDPAPAVRAMVVPPASNGHLLLDLHDYPEILDGLKEAARKHIRTLEHQAVACVQQYLLMENYITEPRPEA